MKRILLFLLVAPSLLFAQSQTPVMPSRPPRPVPALENSSAQGDALPDNYQLTLTLTDNQGQPIELSLVVASKQFKTSLGEQGLTFIGTLSPDDSGAVLVSYALSWETEINQGQSTQFKSSSTGGSVRLKMEKEVPIIRVGSRTARLSIKKFQEPAAK